jgi:hypothetical protein
VTRMSFSLYIPLGVLDAEYDDTKTFRHTGGIIYLKDAVQHPTKF